LDSSISIKQEEIEVPNLLLISNNSNYCEDNYSENEEEYCENPAEQIHLLKPKWIPKRPKVRPQKNAFKCANCKQEHSSFATLEAHIIDCFKSTEEIKCFICQKQLETRKKLYSHMEIHKKFKRPRKRSSTTQKARTIQFNCNKCSFKFDTFSKLCEHKRTHFSETTVRSEDDMNEILLRNAAHLIS